MKPVQLLALLAAAVASLGSPAALAQADALQARSMAASCANCHGTNGRAAPGMVSLAGYDRAALVKAMADFKSGARPATIMHQLAKGYSDAQIEAIAGYFAAQKN
ncbi:MAG: Cytochrome subunit of sulfide dehydrogenase [Pseudomonadota bacterium]|jgi:cytochrome subunit of sulfide dehydrogenase